MSKISGVIITKNEERNIKRCLDSLGGIADEIIVIDSYSTDSTAEICKKHNVNFIKNEFLDYASAKNYGNSKTQYPYIISLDADEEISNELRESLIHVKSNLNEDGYYFKRRTNYCGQWIYHSGWYPDRKLRLFRKSKAQWKGKIHETLELSSNATKLLKGDLLHYSFPTINTHAEKTNLFSELSAQDLYEKKKKVSILKLVIAPVFEFFQKFILKKGFLDGYYGFVISVISAYAKFYKYAKLKDLWIKENALTKIKSRSLKC